MRPPWQAGRSESPCRDLQVLEWQDQVAFGLVKGAHIFRVVPQRRRRLLGLLPGPAETRVSLSQEIAGAPAQLQRPRPVSWGLRPS